MSWQLCGQSCKLQRGSQGLIATDVHRLPGTQNPCPSLPAPHLLPPALLPALLQDRMIVQGDMEYQCWGSWRSYTVGEKAKGDAW